MHKVVFCFFMPILLCSLKAASQQGLNPLTNIHAGAFSLKVLPQNFYKQCLPVSCKGELQMQKITALPLCFRLGSKEYVDYLEKKPNALRPDAGSQK